MEPATQTFDFPFTPYQGQKDFANSFYNLINNSNLGIFESPTGTVPPKNFDPTNKPIGKKYEYYNGSL